MTFTYDPAGLDGSDLFQVRFLLGDTIEAEPLLQDEEINFLIAEHGVQEGAAQGAERLAAKFARLADQKTGDVSTDFDQLQEHYKNLADQIRETGAGGGTGAENTFAGGISKADNASRKSDSDRVPTIFDKGMHDNPLGPIGNFDDERFV